MPQIFFSASPLPTWRSDLSGYLRDCHSYKDGGSPTLRMSRVVLCRRCSADRLFHCLQHTLALCHAFQQDPQQDPQQDLRQVLQQDHLALAQALRTIIGSTPGFLCSKWQSTRTYQVPATTINQISCSPTARFVKPSTLQSAESKSG